MNEIKPTVHAGWNHTRAERQAHVDDIVRKVREVLESPGSGERLVAALFVAVEATRDGQARLHRIGVGYGLGVAMLKELAEETIAGMALSVRDGEHARRESRVKGRKGPLHG